MVKISANRMALNRIIYCRRILEVDTQRLRGRLLERLEQLFNLVDNAARNKNAEIKARDKWVRVAAYTAQTIECIAKGFDEQDINARLNKLERMVNDARAREADKAVREGPTVQK
jgi:hypothetical protein